jgi:fructose-1,6-bisphosphatase/inositol monophosphatase family enzyme
VSIALAIKKQVVVGVVYNPILDELYRSVRGQGAFLNDQQIHVSTVQKIEECVIATNVGYDRTSEGIDFMTKYVFERFRVF